MNYFLLCILGVITMLFLRNMLNWIFSMENYFIHKKRLKQLKFEGKKETTVEDFINIIGGPTRRHILPRLNGMNEKRIQKELEFSGWNKYFNPKSFIAFDITLKIIGLILFIVMFLTDNMLLGVIWGFVLVFLLNFLLENKIDSKLEEIYAFFPDFLRITEGFLSSGMPLLNALEKTLPYVNDEWRRLIKNFIIDFKMQGVNIALDNLKNATNMFEVKEFAVLLRLILDQGGDVKDGFQAQAESIIEMQQFILEKKIAKRKTLSIAIQAPMMIILFVTFGLPIIGDMTKIGLI